MNKKMLKLRARDNEDIQVISAVLQDAIVPVCDMSYQPENKVFIIVAQRLKREDSVTGETERICSALTVNGVIAVQTQGIDMQLHTRMLDLLAIIVDDAAQPSVGHYLSLVFAGDARIRLHCEVLGVRVEDFGQPWPALCNPCHEEA